MPKNFIATKTSALESVPKFLDICAPARALAMI
jgi:hypothetical protein